MRRQGYEEDRVINEYNEACHQANATFWLAAGLFIGWLCVVLLGVGGASQVSAPLTSLARTVLGWGCVTALVLSLLQAAYACLYIYLMTRRS